MDCTVHLKYISPDDCLGQKLLGKWHALLKEHEVDYFHITPHSEVFL